MRHFYSLLFYLLTPVAVFYMLLRGIADRTWWGRWGERFGYYANTIHPSGIVVHAVSVGEVNAALPLVRSISRSWPDVPVTITCFTPTGSARIRESLGPRVNHCYAPLDLPGATRRFFQRFRPRLLVLMETELWPNLLEGARRLGLPVIIGNARLTERSFRRYSRFQSLAGEMLGHVNLIAAQSDPDRKRFIALGAAPDSVAVFGNIKFDLELPENLARTGKVLRSRWGIQRPVIVGGSTHEADEQALLTAFSKLLTTYPDALLVLAPRYPERFARAEELATAQGLDVVRYSECKDTLGSANCLVADTLGKLLELYSASDVVFVGGTLADIGGHNPLEAAALGRPVLLGPHTQNIRALESMLLSCGAAQSIQDVRGLYEALRELLSDRARRTQMGEAGCRLVARERGALSKTLGAIEKVLLQ